MYLSSKIRAAFKALATALDADEVPKFVFLDVRGFVDGSPAESCDLEEASMYLAESCWELLGDEPDSLEPTLRYASPRLLRRRKDGRRCADA